MYLKNIEKIFRLIPTTFIVISTIVGIVITYLLLQSQQESEINLLKQKKILENQFNKKELLHAFNTKVQNTIENELNEIKKGLREHTFKIIGSLQHHLQKNHPDSIVDCLTKYEKENKVFIVLFEETKPKLMYGKERVRFLSELIFGTYNETKKNIVLQYIASQGKYNLQEWKNDLAGTLKLSFFDKFIYKGKDYYVGTFSELVDIRSITKQNIIKQINKQKLNSDHYIWFYDQITGNTYNFNNENMDIKINKIIHLFGDKVRLEFLNELNDAEHIKQFATHFVFQDSKNKLAIAINSTSDLKINQEKIERVYSYKLIEYSALIVIVSLLLLLISRHFALFIKVQLDARELKQRVEEELEKNRQKDRILIQQSKLAAMGEMLGNIAHQWRQPLNNVSLFLQFIQSNYKDDKIEQDIIEKYFHKSFIQINYMSQTIDDFRNFYKPSRQKSNFNIKEAVDSAIDIIGVQLKDANIKLKMNIDNITIFSFENELKQSLLNILSNANQAIKERKQYNNFNPYIKIKVEQKGSNIIISISNNGGSINKKILARIFEPYFTTKFESQGTGVGLYMTKSIIEMNLNGIIEVENFKNGVTFKITLPKNKKE